MLDIRSLEITDFSGGITDFYINAAPNTAEVMDNFFVLSNRSLKSRGGSVIDNSDPDDEQIPIGAQRIGALINYNNDDTLFVQSAERVYYRNASTGAYETLVGPVTSNQVFSSGTTTNYITWTEWNRHLMVVSDAFVKPQKIYKDGSGVLQVRTAGMPALASAPSIAIGSSSTKNYVYAFVHYFTYTIGTEVFEDFGPVTLVEVPLSSEPSSSNNAVSAIPVLANGATDNYDTANIKIHIYRTIDNGTEFFKIGEVTNGTTIFTDNVSDATCADGLPLYTSGGVLDNDPPPKAKFVHTVNGFTYYAHLKNSDNEVLPNNYRQSVQNDPDSVPEQFEDVVEDQIQGFSSVAGIPLVFGTRNVYRVDGSFDEFGQGSMTHVRISDTAGCVSHNGIVQAEGKVFWPGADGFYMSDGFNVSPISFHLRVSYKNFLALLSDPRKIQGAYIPSERKIYWTIQKGGDATDIDACIVLDLEWGISAESTYTTVSGESFSPTAITLFDGKLYRGDRNGYVFIHSDDYFTDPLIDTAADSEDWAEETIIWTYRGPAFNFGTDLVRKYVPRISVGAKNEGDVSVAVTGIVDDGRKVKHCSEIRWRGNFTWGDQLFTWGDEDCIWGGRGYLNQWRHFPKTGLRCSIFQVEITNAYTVVTNSDTLGTATFDNTANTATLDQAATWDWPSDSVGYFLSTEFDSYGKQYPVVSRAADVLTLTDSAGDIPTGSKKWLLSGYRKGEILNLTSYALAWAPLTMSQITYNTSDSGANA